MAENNSFTSHFVELRTRLLHSLIFIFIINFFALPSFCQPFNKIKIKNEIKKNLKNTIYLSEFQEKTSDGKVKYGNMIFDGKNQKIGIGYDNGTIIVLNGKYIYAVIDGKINMIKASNTALKLLFAIDKVQMKNIKN